MGRWDGNGYHPAEDEYYEPRRYRDGELEDDMQDPSAGGLITWFDPYPGRHQGALALALATAHPSPEPEPALAKGGWGAPSPAKPKPRPRILAFMTHLFRHQPRLP